MSNRLAELEINITRAHKKKKAGVDHFARPVAHKPQGSLRLVSAAPPPVPAPSKGLSALVSRWPARAAEKVRALGAMDYTVPGVFGPLAQPSANSCWATVFTMLVSWRRQQSLSIEDALSTVGQKWVDLYRADAGLSGGGKSAFLTAAGLVAEPPQNFTIDGWEQLLRNYGPVWVTTDEAPGKAWAIHARVITAIRGDGTPDNTFFTIVDPAGGRQYQESIAKFIPKYEEEVIRTGYTRIQVVHWSADARSEQRALAYGRRTTNSLAAASSSISTRSSSFDYSGALAAYRQATVLSKSFDIRYNVQLVPQQTSFSCWAAGFAMIIGWRDQMSIDPSEVARATGYWAQYKGVLDVPGGQGVSGGLSPEDTRVMNTWGFVPEAPQTFTVEGFAELLRNFGPLWVASFELGPHIRVVTGMQGDGTPDGTTLHINDPLPLNRGSQYRETYRQFVEKQSTLAGREMSVNAPIYVAHLPSLPPWMNSPVAKSFSQYIGRSIAMEAPSNPANYRLLTSGIWNRNTTLSVQGGQGMWFKIRNTNVLGTTISITDQARQTKHSIILPASSVEFLFTVFGSEPMGWRFDISTDSDAFMVTWELWSTWVPDMPPNG